MTDVRKAKRKMWPELVRRGAKIKKAQQEEIVKRRAEKKREKELERLKKRTELFKAQYTEREALARKREAARHARHVSAPRYIYGKLSKATKKTDKSLAKSITRKRGKKSKIGWL